jgi:DNA-binding transcriptional ArsR family regulator
MSANKRVTALGAFCPNCGCSVTRLSAGQKRVLACIMIVEREYEEYRITSNEKYRRFPVSRAQIEDRSGLHHSTVVNTITVLRELGYIESRKSYGHSHLFHRLSDATRGDPTLMDMIERWCRVILEPEHMVPGYSLRAQARKETAS